VISYPFRSIKDTLGPLYPRVSKVASLAQEALNLFYYLLLIVELLAN
jgi:hypothetical protein